MDTPVLPRRPLSVTITGLLVLFLSVIYWTRFFLSLANWDFLRSLLPFSPAYLAVTGIFWGTLGIWCFWRLWLGLRYGRELALVVSMLFSIYYWLDRLLLSGFSGWSVNWPYALGVNLIWLGWIALICNRPGVRRFFDRT